MYYQRGGTDQNQASHWTLRRSPDHREKKRKLKWYLLRRFCKALLTGGRWRGRQRKKWWEDDIMEWTGLTLNDSPRKSEETDWQVFKGWCPHGQIPGPHNSFLQRYLQVLLHANSSQTMERTPCRRHHRFIGDRLQVTHLQPLVLTSVVFTCTYFLSTTFHLFHAHLVFTSAFTSRSGLSWISAQM